MRVKAPQKKCALCQEKLQASPFTGLWLHPATPRCGVRLSDDLGLPADDRYYIAEDDNQIYAYAPDTVSIDGSVAGGFAITHRGVVHTIGPSDDGFVSVDYAARLLFEQAGLPALGGMSGLRGWSSISTFQKCPYLWSVRYGGRKSPIDEKAPRAETLEIGSLVHLFLAIMYSRRIDPKYPLQPEQAFEFLQTLGVTPARLSAAWNYYQAYVVWYGDESWMTPLAVEELALDPVDGFSCRWDLVFKLQEPYEGLLPGVYVCNTKTSSRNDRTTHDEWRNDGQIIGEIDLYNRLGYKHRWGPLRGNCINMIVKTQNPVFWREWVFPPDHVIKDHRKSLTVWNATMNLAIATGNFPRSRSGCVTRYNTLCELHDHCSGANEIGDQA